MLKDQHNLHKLSVNVHMTVKERKRKDNNILLQIFNIYIYIFRSTPPLNHLWKVTCNAKPTNRQETNTQWAKVFSHYVYKMSARRMTHFTTHGMSPKNISSNQLPYLAQHSQMEHTAQRYKQHRCFIRRCWSQGLWQGASAVSFMRETWVHHTFS